MPVAVQQDDRILNMPGAEIGHITGKAGIACISVNRALCSKYSNDRNERNIRQELFFVISFLASCYPEG